MYLNPEREEYGPNYESGQIRIAFAPGNLNENSVLHGGVILGGNPAARDYGDSVFQMNKLWSDDFHKFTLVWKPGKYFLIVHENY